MVAELVAAMESYMGSDFDAAQTVADFVRAMQLDDAFGKEVKKVHAGVKARAATMQPRNLLAPLQPVFDQLLVHCSEVLGDADA